MSIKERAIEYHREHCNCAQSVLAACSEYTGFSEETALAISAGFGGGVRSGEVCGAISGAVMACGLAFPVKGGDDAEGKEKIARLAMECVNICRSKYGCVRCQDLKNLGITCRELIGYVAEEAEKLIIENK